MELDGVPVDLEGPADGPELIKLPHCGVRFKRAGKWSVRMSNGESRPISP